MERTTAPIMLSVFFVLLVMLGLHAGEWFVAPPPLGNDRNPGTEQEPFATIQKGIRSATDSDTVFVAPGTYVGNIGFAGKNIVVRSMDPNDWDVVKATVIDGNQAGSVVTLAGTEDETCVLAGFTITNGTGTLVSGVALNGGGICGTTDLGTLPRLTIRNNIITGNSADNGGGIMGCAGVIENCFITGNAASQTPANCCGGGIAFCNGIIQNNVIAGNTALWGGGICYSNADLRNNIFVGNAAGGLGGALAYLGTSPYTPPGGSVTNCIIWANTAPTGPDAYGAVAPTYCCIQGWTYGGPGNMGVDPQFVDVDGPDDDPNTFEDNDYRLLATSPCIDAGTNEDWMNGAVDLDGRPRILFGKASLTVDIGAYELRFPLAIVMETDTGVQLSWTMRPQTSYSVLSSFDITAEPWTEETTIFGGKSGGPALWTDPAASSALKYYKLEVK